MKYCIDQNLAYRTPANWWSSGTDVGRNGVWLWATSCRLVPDLVWIPNYPNNPDNHNCMTINFKHGFLGSDEMCFYENPPICQRK